MQPSYHRIVLWLTLGWGAGPGFAASAQTNTAPADPPATPVLEINAGKVTGPASPTLYGMMTEEINYSYEGGLYGELLRNRTFKAGATNALYWNPVGGGALSLDYDQPLNAALNVSLKLDATSATPDAPAGFANAGYWGIPIRPNTLYRASFYARTDGKFAGPLTVALVSAPDGLPHGEVRPASAEVSQLTAEWKKYEVTLTTGDAPASKNASFRITTDQPGTIWFSQVSLFPPTYDNRPNGNRPDLMELMADMNPQFLRFPGGNYLEGNEIANRFDWKKTIGDTAERPGHRNDGWGYWSTDGLGLLEFLEWCEDLRMQPVLAVYAGYSMHQRHVTPGDDLDPYVQDALDEIEYVTGPTTSTWGARRAKDGHPDPFPLNYVEIGNEDWFDQSNTYDARFTQFFKAIKAQYPKLQCISTIGSTEPKAKRVHTVQPDLLDDHFYRTQQEMRLHAHDYDSYDRHGPKIFVGEWATRVGSPTPNLAGALGDAAWMTGLERNSDLVLISSYAPLFVNVSDLASGRTRGGSMQWPTDLIGYDAFTSYGSPAYYAQKMFSNNHGDQILATDSQGIPVESWQPPVRRSRNPNPATATNNAAAGTNSTPAALPPKQSLPTLFFDATRDSHDGILYLKIVNIRSHSQRVHVIIDGAKQVNHEGEIITLTSANPDDTNSIKNPQKVVPRTALLNDLGRDFTPTLEPNSINILKIHTVL